MRCRVRARACHLSGVIWRLQPRHRRLVSSRQLLLERIRRRAATPAAAAAARRSSLRRVGMRHCH